MTTRGFGPQEFRQVGKMIVRVLDGLSQHGEDNGEVEAEIRKEAVALCRRFPIYPDPLD